MAKKKGSSPIKKVEPIKEPAATQKASDKKASAGKSNSAKDSGHKAAKKEEVKKEEAAEATEAMKEEVASNSSNAVSEKKLSGNSNTGRTVAVAAVSLVAGIVITAGACTAFQTAQNTSKAAELEAQLATKTAELEALEASTSELANGQDALTEAVGAHTHTWVPNYETVHHDAVYEDVYHAAVYENQTTYHSVCNECGAVVDGIAVQHITDTGHSGYSVNVPITNEVLVQAAYTEPVLVSEAYDETVITGVTCTSCGEVLSTEEAAEEGVSVPAAE